MVQILGLHGRRRLLARRRILVIVREGHGGQPVPFGELRWQRESIGASSGGSEFGGRWRLRWGVLSGQARWVEVVGASRLVMSRLVERTKLNLE
jgi:hypothetical protein